MKQRIVLIAQSSVEIQSEMANWYQRQGFETIVASGGTECMELLCGMNPILIVLDQHLLWGGADGVLACLRSEPQWQAIPVLLTNGRRRRPQTYCDVPTGASAAYATPY